MGRLTEYWVKSQTDKVSSHLREKKSFFYPWPQKKTVTSVIWERKGELQFKGEELILMSL